MSRPKLPLLSSVWFIKINPSIRCWYLTLEDSKNGYTKPFRGFSGKLSWESPFFSKVSGLTTYNFAKKRLGQWRLPINFPKQVSGKQFIGSSLFILIHPSPIPFAVLNFSLNWFLMIFHCHCTVLCSKFAQKQNIFQLKTIYSSNKPKIHNGIRNDTLKNKKYQIYIRKKLH